MLGHKTTILPESSQSNERTIQPSVETYRQSSQGAAARTNWPDAWDTSMKLHVYRKAGEILNTSENMYITTVDDELNVDKVK